MLNPLDVIAAQARANEHADDPTAELESTSALINDTQGMCPKCSQPFGNASVGGMQVYYCEPCRVTQPIPVSS